MADRLGIDIGSKTIKFVLLSEADGSVLRSDYYYHQSRVQHCLLSVFQDLRWRCGDDREVAITVTGSAGLRVAELFDIPFVQEVVALKRAIGEVMPDADAVLEMGGEDTKLLYLTGVPEQRMNTVCAGGTGGFIDMMASVMGVRTAKMQRLATGYTTIYPIASRCAVFAKSDVRPLMNSGAKREDIAASVLEAVCTQAVAGLSAGRPLKGKVALVGGPFHHIPAMRDAFCRVTGIPRSDALIPRNAHLLVARGAAISPQASEPATLGFWTQQFVNSSFADLESIKRLPPLFASQEEYEQFKAQHAACVIPRAKADDNASGNYFIGIDAGSTTVKVALVDESGALCAWSYEWNHGDVSEILPDLLQQTYRAYRSKWSPERHLRRSCVVGYGEQFCQAAYKVDMGTVETVAHLRAAVELEPDVDFLMDIGGQDIKCFYIKDGVIEDIVLNEACSSGCGSLFDTIARSTHHSKESFAKMALFAQRPVDLGTRCSTFMDSRVKHAQKDGVGVDDIAAGVCYSTARNALFKVVKRPDFKSVGTHVVVQGGAFANDALLRAFELETGVEAIRPDHAELMGAWGAALIARDEWMLLKQRDEQAALATESTLLSADELSRLCVKRKVVRCGICPNVCKLTVTSFLDGRDATEGRSLVSGNRCERGARAHNDLRVKPLRLPNMIKYKNELISSFGVRRTPSRGTTQVIGIPRVLALYESYPFWVTFFSELGFGVAAARTSDEGLYRDGMGMIPSEGACYPSKLLFGHCAQLVDAGADVLFAPSLPQAFAREGLLGLAVPEVQECPVLESAPTMLEGNADTTQVARATLLCPDFRGVRDDETALSVLGSALAEAGLACGEDEIARAFATAREKYRELFVSLEAKNAEILECVARGDMSAALVMGHPYHADPGISHGVDELLNELGLAVLERMDYDFAALEIPGHKTWMPLVDLDHALEASKAYPELQLIAIRSFGCGIDALAADEIGTRVRKSGRIRAELKIDQIVDLAAVRIRLRSLAYAMRQRTIGVDTVPTAARGEGAYEEAMSATALHEARIAAMDERGYELAMDHSNHQTGLYSFFNCILFNGPNGLAQFEDWDAVDAFLKEGKA